MNTPYIGNGAYCYANSTSMLLASIGENVSPSTIEVLTGVGLSASLKRKNGFLYFNNQTLLPDLGISKALEILGFDSKTEVFENPEDNPFVKLKRDLEKSAAILGPLDMFYLVYNPRHEYLIGADHFILAYKMEGDTIYLHDPAGFPHVFILTKDLKEAWKAERVSYRKGYFRYITNVEGKEKPTQEEVYARGLDFLKSIYQEGRNKSDPNVWLIGKEAIINTAERAESGSISEGEAEHFVHFALPLGAKRALDYGSFFKPFNRELSELKYEQSKIFGRAHTYTMEENWKLLAKVFIQLAEVEERFETTLLSS